MSQPVEPLSPFPEPLVETEGGPEAPEAAAMPPAQVLTPVAPPPPGAQGPAHLVADPDEPVTAPVEHVLVPELVTRVVSTSTTFDSATLDRPRPAAGLAGVRRPISSRCRSASRGGRSPDGTCRPRSCGMGDLCSPGSATWAPSCSCSSSGNSGGTSISQHQAQDQLRSAFEASLRAHHPPKQLGRDQR